MSSSTSFGSESGRDEILAEILEAFLEKLRRGESLSAEEWLNRYPDYADDLRPCLESLAFVTAAELNPDDNLQQTPGVPDQIADFEIRRELGRGGMGVVFEAYQVSLNRTVALKVLPLAGILDDRLLTRFRNEAQAAGLIHHPNVVPVYQVGSDRGVHFYAMQYVDGVPLSTLIAEFKHVELGHDSMDDHFSGPQTPPRVTSVTKSAFGCDVSPGITRRDEFFRAVAKIGHQAAEALESAHQTGILHRDVKPANLMIDSSGKLWVTDFGLARIGEEQSLTMTGDLLGTVRYMSPEQALAQRDVVDRRSDVYSLGATLFELVTLRPLIQGDDREVILRRITYNDSESASQSNAKVPDELDTIILKATQKHPGDRYASAQLLADDLKRYLDDRPITARRPTVLQRVRKWVRRHRQVVSAVTGTLLLGLITIGPLTVWQFSRRAHEAESAAQQLRMISNQQRNELYSTEVLVAQGALQLGNRNLAVQLLEKQPADLRTFPWFYLWRQCHPFIASLEHGAPVHEIQLAPGESHVAVAGELGYVRLFDLRRIEAPPLEFSVEFSTVASLVFVDPHWLVLAGGDGWRAAGFGHGTGAIEIWNWQTGVRVATVPDVGSMVYKMVTLPRDNPMIVTAHADGQVKVWQWDQTGADTGTPTGNPGHVKMRAVKSIQAHRRRSVSLAVSPSGDQIATRLRPAEVTTQSSCGVRTLGGS